MNFKLIKLFVNIIFHSVNRIWYHYSSLFFGIIRLEVEIWLMKRGLKENVLKLMEMVKSSLMARLPKSSSGNLLPLATRIWVDRKSRKSKGKTWKQLWLLWVNFDFSALTRNTQHSCWAFTIKKFIKSFS